MVILDPVSIGNALFSILWNIIWAVILIVLFFSLGFFVAKIINMIIRKAIEKARIEDWIVARGLDRALLGFGLTRLVTVLVKVFVIFVFLGTAVDILAAEPFNVELGILGTTIQSFLIYMPSFAQGTAIIVVTLLIGTYITDVIRRERKILFAEQVGLGIKVIVGYIAIILALPLFLPGLESQVKVLSDLLVLVLQAVVIAFGLGVGLAVGLGLKDAVAKAAAKNQQAIDSIFGSLRRR